MIMRTYVRVTLTTVFGGLALWGWRYRHRRAWPTSKKDEAMRRHVNKAYD